MKILHCVENYLPSRSGMQEVVTQLSERLVAKGFDVQVVTSYDARRESNVINGVPVVSFGISGNYANGYKGDTNAYQQFLLASDADVIVNFAAQQWSTDLMLPIMNQLKARKVFVPTGFSALYRPEYAAYYENMKDWLFEYDMNIFLSYDYQDVNFAKALGVEKWMVIPNGAASEEFEQSKLDIRQQLNIPADAFLILHVGSFTGLKGHLEAIQIFKKAALPNAVLLLVGNSHANTSSLKSKMVNFLKFVLSGVTGKRPVGAHYYSVLADKYNKSQRGNRIITTSLNREEVVACYKAADLFLFPSMIECSPIVLFESMASHTPFVTNVVGNAKEIISWSNGGVLLPTTIDAAGYSRTDIAGAAKVVTELYHDAAKRATLADAGYLAFEGKFTWDKIADQYAALYKSF